MSGAICYAQPTPLTVAMGTLLIAGTLLSYVPWFVALIRRRSSAGVSIITLSSGLLSGSLSLTNAGILNWDKIICCGQHRGELAADQCLANNLVVEQVPYLCPPFSSPCPSSFTI